MTRKPRFQPSLASLTIAELEQLAAWLHAGTFEDLHERVRKPKSEGGFGLNISIRPLQTFFAKVLLLDLINSRLPADKKLTLATFLSLSSGEIHLYSADAADAANESSANGPSATAAPQASEVHDAILRATADLADSGDNNPTQLLALQRLADFPARLELREERRELDHQKFEHKREMDAFRKEVAATRLDLAKQSFAFRQKQHEDRLALAREKLAAKPSRTATSAHSDHLGPYARNWDEVSERARIHFGVSKEEWARRQALHDLPTPAENLNESAAPSTEPSSLASETAAPVETTAPLKPLNPTPISASSVLVPPSATPSNSAHACASLPPAICDLRSTEVSPSLAPVPSAHPIIVAATPLSVSSVSSAPSVLAPPQPDPWLVDAYTVRRAEEYWAWRRLAASLPEGQSPPPFFTAYRHCPCGQPTPCPIHEAEPCGEFPTYFWSLSPHHYYYESCLIARQLFYRDPCERVPEEFRIYDRTPSCLAS